MEYVSVKYLILYSVYTHWCHSESQVACVYTCEALDPMSLYDDIRTTISALLQCTM